MREMVAFVSVLALVGCGDNGTPPKCSGSSCSCQGGQTCTFNPNICGPTSCSIDCTDHNVCNGSCADSCSVNCAANSSCSIQLGPSGSVSCTGNSICHIACTGTCSVSCSSGSTCDLKCPGSGAYQSIPQGGHC